MGTLNILKCINKLSRKKKINTSRPSLGSRFFKIVFNIWKFYNNCFLKFLAFANCNERTRFQIIKWSLSGLGKLYFYHLQYVCRTTTFLNLILTFYCIHCIFDYVIKGALFALMHHYTYSCYVLCSRTACVVTTRITLNFDCLVSNKAELKEKIQFF
jgi:hypothetical protein